MHLNGKKKNRKMSFNGRNLARNEQMDRKFVYENILDQGDCLPSPVSIYMYMTIIFKHLPL